MEEKIRKKRLRNIVLITIAIIIVAIVGIYFFLKYQTYSYMQVIDTYESKGTDNAEYKQCMEGVLRYSKDGVALLSKKGEEIWNQPYQMKNPIVEMCGDSIAVGDKGGTSIFVFEKKGLKGEMQTTRPIEKLTVSSQGVVGAILKDEEIPKVMCYDAQGEVLVEHNVSTKSTGYPVDIALSEDGDLLLVSYLYVDGNTLTSKVTYYYFGEEAEDKTDYQVLEKEFGGAVVPVTTFLDKNTSLVVADNGLYFFEGVKQPAESTSIVWEEEIQSIAYNNKMIAVVLKSKDSSGYKLHIYNKDGEELATVDLEREYTHIKVVEDQVILFDAEMCSIYVKNGVHKYEGKMEERIMEIFPLAGLNKYMAINASGFQKVRLVQ